MDRDLTLVALRRGDLAGAREIRLPNGLSEFPQELFGLADTLELLDLGRGTYGLPDDLSRLRALKVLFCSGTPFTRLPPVLGACKSLSQVGFRGCGIAEIPAEALPPALRWLTLTDNDIAALPDALGECPRLQKLMLAGNRLCRLPVGLANAASLELIRVASNRFEKLPFWLSEMPALAWLSYSGNPTEPRGAVSDPAQVPWSALTVGPLLGEGSSGRVHRTLWRGGTGDTEVALKLFKGAVGSDGLPEREIEACLAAGDHPSLIGALGRLDRHPEGTPGLLLRLLPAGWPVLAAPPSLASCSRDVYDPALRFAPGAALRLATGIASAVTHLHRRGLMHGDLYGHNILWDGSDGAAVLGDFGAASSLPGGQAGRALARIETRAFGILLGEVLDRCDHRQQALRDLQDACTGPDPSARPEMAEVDGILDTLA